MPYGFFLLFWHFWLNGYEGRLKVAISSGLGIRKIGGSKNPQVENFEAIYTTTIENSP